MLRKKTNGVAFGPRASIANGKARGEVVDRRTFLTRSGLVAGAAAAAAAAPAGLVTRKAQAQAIAARNMVVWRDGNETTIQIELDGLN